MFAIDGGVTKPLVNTNVWPMSSLGGSRKRTKQLD